MNITSARLRLRSLEPSQFSMFSPYIACASFVLRFVYRAKAAEIVYIAAQCAQGKNVGGKMTKKIGWGQVMVQKRGKRVQKATYTGKLPPPCLPQQNARWMNIRSNNVGVDCFGTYGCRQSNNNKNTFLHLVSSEKRFSAWLHLLNLSGLWRQCNHRSGVHSKWKIVCLAIMNLALRPINATDKTNVTRIKATRETELRDACTHTSFRLKLRSEKNVLIKYLIRWRNDILRLPHT